MYISLGVGALFAFYNDFELFSVQKHSRMNALSQMGSSTDTCDQLGRSKESFIQCQIRKLSPEKCGDWIQMQVPLKWQTQMPALLHLLRPLPCDTATNLRGVWLFRDRIQLQLEPKSPSLGAVHTEQEMLSFKPNSWMIFAFITSEGWFI